MQIITIQDSKNIFSGATFELRKQNDQFFILPRIHIGRGWTRISSKLIASQNAFLRRTGSYEHPREEITLLEASVAKTFNNELFLMPPVPGGTEMALVWIPGVGPAQSDTTWKELSDRRGGSELMEGLVCLGPGESFRVKVLSSMVLHKPEAEIDSYLISWDGYYVCWNGERLKSDDADSGKIIWR